VSVKDRWIGPREQVLNRSHVGDMGPVSLVVDCQQKFDFFPLLHWLLWERNQVRTRGSVSRNVMEYLGSSSSWEQWICSNMLTIMRKVAICGPREIHMVEGHTWTRGKRVAYWSDFSL
jgi:hypothetical protein